MMLKLMGYSGRLLLKTSLFAIAGLQWFYRLEDGMIADHDTNMLDNDVQFEMSTSTEALQESPDVVTSELLRQLMFAVNLPDQVNTPAQVEELLRRGHRYNFWPVDS
jgi:hypothetical protein